jgi:hypothetical protein
MTFSISLGDISGRWIEITFRSIEGRRDIGNILDGFRQLALELRVADAIEFVDHQDRVAVAQAPHDLGQFRGSEVAGGQELLEVVDVGSRAARRPGGGVEKPAGKPAQEAAKHLLEGEFGAAGAAQHQIAGIAGDFRHHIGQRGLAPAPLAEDDDVGALFLDRPDDPLHLVVAAGEQAAPMLGLARGEGLAQSGARPRHRGMFVVARRQQGEIRCRPAEARHRAFLGQHLPRRPGPHRRAHRAPRRNVHKLVERHRRQGRQPQIQLRRLGGRRVARFANPFDGRVPRLDVQRWGRRVPRRVGWFIPGGSIGRRRVGGGLADRVRRASALTKEAS